MTTLYDRLIGQHRLWLQHSSAATSASERLRTARVLLVAGGNVGLQTALRLRGLPLSHLFVLAVHEREIAEWRPILAQPAAAERVSIGRQKCSTNGFGVLLANYDLVVLAVNRPYPSLAEGINRACQRIGVAWTQLQTWGAEITLGPSVLPGITACYGCYRLRLRANESRADVWAAREQFFHNDSTFAFGGNLSAFVNTAASYAAIEVERLLTGAAPPLALSREMHWNWLEHTSSQNHVAPAEHCAVCGGTQTALQLDHDTLAAVVARLQPQRQPAEVSL